RWQGEMPHLVAEAAAPAEHWKPLEFDAEHVDQEDTAHEYGRAQTNNRSADDSAIKGLPALQRGADPEGDAEQHGKDEGVASQEERRRQARVDLVADGEGRLDRIPKMKLCGALRPEPVLRQKRVVQVVLGPQRPNCLGASRDVA